MEAYLLGFYGNKLRIYDRTPGAPVKLCDYDIDIVEEAYKIGKLRFSGFEVDENERDFSKYTLLDFRYNFKESNKTYVKRSLYLIDIIQVGEFEYSLVVISPFDGEEIIISTNNLKNNLDSKLKYILNASFVPTVDSGSLNNGIMMIENSISYKVKSKIYNKVPKTFPIKYMEPTEEDNATYSKLSLLGSDDTIIEDILKHGKFNCKKWYNMYQAYLKSTNIEYKVKLNTSKFHLPIDLEKVYSKFRDKNRRLEKAYNNITKILGTKTPDNGKIIQIINYFTYFGKSLNLTLNDYTTIVRHFETGESMRLHIASGAFKILSIAIAEADGSATSSLWIILMHNMVIYETVTVGAENYFRLVDMLANLHSRKNIIQYDVSSLISVGDTQPDTEYFSLCSGLMPKKLAFLINYALKYQFFLIKELSNNILAYICYTNNTIIIQKVDTDISKGKIIYITKEGFESLPNSIQREINVFDMEYNTTKMRKNLAKFEFDK